MWLSTACKKPVFDPVTHIPASAQSVAIINFEKMTRKAVDLQSIMSLDVIEQAQQAADVMKEHNLEKSGISIMGKLYVIIDSAQAGGQVIHIFAPLSSEKQFTAYIKEHATSAINVPKEGWQQVLLPQGTASWNKTYACISFSSKSKEAASQQADIIINLPENNQLVAANKRFKEMAQATNDAILWSRFTPAKAYLPLRIPRRVSINEYLYQTELQAYLNFDKGEISGKLIVHSEHKDVRELMTLIKNNDEPAASLARIPFGNPSAVVTMNIDMPKTIAMWQYSGLAEKVEPYMFFIGISLQEIFKAIDGQIVWSINALPNAEITDIKKVSQELMSSGHISFGLRNDSIYDKIMTNLVSHGVLNDNGEHLDSDWSQLALVPSEGYFSLVGSEEVCRRVIKAKEVLNENVKMKLNKPVAVQVYVNGPSVAALLPGYAHNLANRVATAYADASIQDGDLHADLVVVTNDPQQNSLITLLHALHKHQKEQQEPLP